MKVVTLVLVLAVVGVEYMGVDFAYKKGYRDGIQYARDTISYELHRNSRERLIQETEDLQSTPEA